MLEGIWDEALNRIASPLKYVGNRSVDFYNISWQGMSKWFGSKHFPSLFGYGLFERFPDNAQQFVRCSPNKITQGLKPAKEREYPYEDFAYFAECYAEHQMKLWLLAENYAKNGKFELAAKYLYAEWATPFSQVKEQHGYVGNTSFLTFGKTNRYQKIKQYLAQTDPSKIPTSTLEAIGTIEEEYILPQIIREKK
jgi:hypothetical protein